MIQLDWRGAVRDQPLTFNFCNSIQLSPRRKSCISYDCFFLEFHSKLCFFLIWGIFSFFPFMCNICNSAYAAQINSYIEKHPLQSTYSDISLVESLKVILRSHTCTIKPVPNPQAQHLSLSWGHQIMYSASGKYSQRLIFPHFVMLQPYSKMD